MRKFEQRSIVLFALGVLGAFGVPGHSVAQDSDLTSGNMAIVVHTGAGGSLDTLARTAAELLTRNEGWSVRVENRQGGNGAVALAHLMSQPADGRTLLGVTKALSNNFALERAPAELGDIGFLTTLQSEPTAIAVRADSPLQTVADYVAALQEAPDSLRVGGSGQGGNDVVHFLLNDLAGIESTWVPFDPVAELVVALQGGHLDVAFLSPSSAPSQIAAGEFRMLAVSGDERSPSYPDVPTLGEAGYDIDALLWRGLVLRAGTPPEVVEALQTALTEIQKEERWQEMMDAQNQNTFVVQGAQFQEMVEREVEQLKQFYRSAGLIE